MLATALVSRSISIIFVKILIRVNSLLIRAFWTAVSQTHFKAFARGIESCTRWKRRGWCKAFRMSSSKGDIISWSRWGDLFVPLPRFFRRARACERLYVSFVSILHLVHQASMLLCACVWSKLYEALLICFQHTLCACAVWMCAHMQVCVCTFLDYTHAHTCMTREYLQFCMHVCVCVCKSSTYT